MQKKIQYSNIQLAIVVLFSLFGGTQANCTSDDNFIWGQGKSPDHAQAAIVGQPYPKSEMKVLSVTESEQDDDYQANILGKPAPFSKPVELRRFVENETVELELLDAPVLIEVANSDPEVFGPGEVESHDLIQPIKANDPNFMGRGTIFSLYRSKNTNEEGKANGILCVGTGFLVSPSCVITAGHNVTLNSFIRRQFPHLSPYAERVEFWPLMNGFNRDMFDPGGKLYDKGVRATSFTTHIEWDQLGNVHKDFDVAVLKLTQKIGFDYGWVQPTIGDLSHLNMNAVISGYPVDQDNRQSFSCIMTSCVGSISNVASHRIYYSVDPLTQKGQSGSPIALSDEKIPPKVIGSHANGPSPSGGVIFNQDKYDLIGKWVKALESEV